MCWGHGRWIILWPLVAVLGQQGEDHHGGGADDSTQREELQWREKLNSSCMVPYGHASVLALKLHKTHWYCRIPSNYRKNNENRMSILSCSVPPRKSVAGVLSW